MRWVFDPKEKQESLNEVAEEKDYATFNSSRTNRTGNMTADFVRKKTTKKMN